MLLMLVLKDHETIYKSRLQCKDQKQNQISQASRVVYLCKMEAALKKCFFAIVVLLVNVFEVGSTKNVILYGMSSQSVTDIAASITVNNKDLTSEAHVLKSKIQLVSDEILQLTVNLSVLPSHCNATFIMDELCVNVGNQRQRSLGLASQDLWLEDWSTKRPLAHVTLEATTTGYQAINLRGILGEWLKNRKQNGVLRMVLKPGAIKAREVIALNVKRSPFVVLYTNRLTITHLPKPAVTCHSQQISVPASSNQVMFPKRVQIKICSSLSGINFPFNASSVFDVGLAVRKYLKSNPVSRNSPVWRNPRCCHALGSISTILLTHNGQVRLENANVEKCGCKDV